ncbi:MAG: 7-cyano-7-deazaguanine/7-aminomethyl-7-deazaguanine transporter [Candidimonas sp.]|nr:MAG: 7-cyano-7-deazaguanine/7-aminomethyl-7-deazaguanine transporter [Candidimonas sp.]
MTSPSTPRPRASFYLAALVTFHILVIIASNYLVQLPIDLFGFHSTWGAFSFPFIFLATDLTVRLIGKSQARRVILRAMVPALIASYIVSVLFHEGRFNGIGALGEFSTLVFRIAFASFAAYALGQLLDVLVFDRMRRAYRQWWLAPAASALFGQALDTATFFAVAFWHSSNPFMAEHWGEIAVVDYIIKLTVSLLLFVPAYGVILSAIIRFMKKSDLVPGVA